MVSGNNNMKGLFRRVGGTDKAYLLRLPEDKTKTFWIPRSVLTHVSVIEKPVGDHELVQITVEAWWVKKNPQWEKYFS